MRSNTSALTSPIVQNLKRLAVLRLIVCCGIALALALIGLEQTPPMQKFMLWGILTTLTLLSLLNLWRAKHNQAAPYELFAYLLADTVLIAGLIYVSGGANNPFITYLLVPIVISAATLSWAMTWILCMLSMALYGFLLFFYFPLPALDHHLAHAGLSFHIIGMWFTFILSALLIAYFVVEMAFDLREKEKQTAHYREQVLQNEHLMLLASQAASTAHELGSPLTTIKMLSHELQQLKNLDNDSREDLQLIHQQIELCQQKLKRLSQPSQLDVSDNQSLHAFLHNTTQQWLLLQPNAKFIWADDFKTINHSPQVQYPLVLMQAIINLLDNANHASDQPIELSLKWNAQFWQMDIQDYGEGIADDFSLPNQPVESSNGLGIGLLLSHSSILRIGGSVTLGNYKQGCLTTIKVPFHVE
ncbi:sensor histidine kinase [Bermanella sp. WJH001]|uniref:sensor histidine kinase n=1 Tax=Bermanella sp. WJH001 TaxID=3048005 RepID=UPI0024BE6174|nr:HAMP domain-containing sensor histidine kinase [Bermanella sp. WJH001]MDJ1539531.1 HAMP domain-containing sensor histidine kinase [Bermanella sp. WJH001]